MGCVRRLRRWFLFSKGRWLVKAASILPVEMKEEPVELKEESKAVATEEGEIEDVDVVEKWLAECKAKEMLRMFQPLSPIIEGSEGEDSEDSEDEEFHMLSNSKAESDADFCKSPEEEGEACRKNKHKELHMREKEFYIEEDEEEFYTPPSSPCFAEEEYYDVHPWAMAQNDLIGNILCVIDEMYSPSNY